ncbi:Zinc knuckle domain containing protein [Plakobranchus ocellatus]|uniref:Zinc knuckle domain containing protein n=1 Tax=Plakobranchus ocellatus TaxID=259542 RepID=A0AAV3Y749_9GAST|nr:Zinc knuckle domain containing protein [Plakobranchus ocellatus]
MEATLIPIGVRTVRDVYLDILVTERDWEISKGEIVVTVHDPQATQSSDPVEEIQAYSIPHQLDKHLDKDEEMGVIEKATGPTPWVSPLVIVPKPKNPDEIRVFVDMRAPNTAIRREKHNTPTLNELSITLADAKYFIKIDLNQGYNQLELNEESRYITTFATHRGLYRYKRLNFGVNNAAEIFQEVIRQTLNGLSGVINVSDDILVYGKSKEVHNQNLRKVLERLRSKNLTLNKKKCEFMKPSIEFLEHFFTAEVFKPCPSKLQKFGEMPTPTRTNEVRSLLGMMNFCGAHFIPGYATLSYELRRLHRKTQRSNGLRSMMKH